MTLSLEAPVYLDILQIVKFPEQDPEGHNNVEEVIPPIAYIGLVAPLPDNNVFVIVPPPVTVLLFPDKSAHVLLDVL